jgi:MFS family permease
MIAAPLSETFGRRAVYQISAPAFAFFIMGSGFSQNIETLIILRFFAGLFGSPSLSIGSATIADVWAPTDRAIPMAAYVCTPFMGPALGPLLGGYATMGENWRWTAWVTLFVVVICIAPIFLGMRETYKKTILQKRARRERKARDETQPERPPLGRKMLQFFRLTLARPLYMLFTEPIPGLFSLYVAFNFAVQYTFFAAFPLIFEEFYGFNLGQVGLTFLGLGVGVIPGFIILIVFTIKFYKPWVIELKSTHAKAVRAAQAAGEDAPKSSGVVPPEWRLILAIPASILMPVSLFLFAWTAGITHWIVPVIAEGIYDMGQLLIFMSATLYVTDCYGPLYGASAMAANTLLRYIMGAAFPLFAVQTYARLGVHWATSLLAFISCVLAFIPWCFWKWGPVLRQKQRFKQGD